MRADEFVSIRSILTWLASDSVPREEPAFTVRAADWVMECEVDADRGAILVLEVRRAQEAAKSV